MQKKENISTIRFENKQTIFNILSQFTLNGTNFLLILLFARYLSTESYGVVSIYQAYVQFFAVIIGLNTQGSIGTAFVRIDEIENKFRYLRNIFFFSVISFIAVSVIIIIANKPFSMFSQLSLGLIILMLFHSFGMFSFNFISTKYVYLRQAEWNFILSISLSIIMLVLAVVCIKLAASFSKPYYSRILGLAITYILCSILVTISLVHRKGDFQYIKDDLDFCIPICLPLVIHGLAQVVLSQTDKVMMQKMLNDYSSVGIYSFIVTFSHVIGTVYSALNNTWIPIYYDCLKRNDDVVLINRARKYIRFYTNVMCVFLLATPEVVQVIARDEYWIGIKIIPIVCLYIYMIFLYSFSVNFELYAKNSKYIALGTFFAAVANIVLNYFLIPHWGMYGAAIATFVSYFLMFLFHYISANYFIKINFPITIRFYIVDFLYFCAIIILFYIAVDFWIIRMIALFVISVYSLLLLKKNKSLF